MAKATCRTKAEAAGRAGRPKHLRGARAGGRGLRAWRRGRGWGRGRLAAPAVGRGWSCPWRRHRPWAPRPAAPYRARAEWPRGASALPPAGGGRTGRGDRPGRGGRCFSFTFLPSEAGALAGEERRWRRRRPRGRYQEGLRGGRGTPAAPALPAQVCARSGSGTSTHLPRPALPGAGRAPRGRGLGRPAGVWGLRSRVLPSGAERAAGCRRSAPGEAARLPPRSPGRARAARPPGPGPRTCRAGGADLGLDRPGPCRRSCLRTRKSSVAPRHSKYLLPLTVLVTGLCGLFSSYHPRSGPCISSFRRLSLNSGASWQTCGKGRAVSPDV